MTIEPRMPGATERWEAMRADRGARLRPSGRPEQRALCSTVTVRSDLVALEAAGRIRGGAMPLDAARLSEQSLEQAKLAAGPSRPRRHRVGFLNWQVRARIRAGRSA